MTDSNKYCGTCYYGLIIHSYGKEEQLGIKKRTKKSNNKQVQELSTEQKNIRLEISKCKSKNKRRELQIERNSILTRIHQLLKDEKQTEIEHQIEEIETYT